MLSTLCKSCTDAHSALHFTIRLCRQLKDNDEASAKLLKFHLIPLLQPKPSSIVGRDSLSGIHSLVKEVLETTIDLLGGKSRKRKCQLNDKLKKEFTFIISIKYTIVFCNICYEEFCISVGVRSNKEFWSTNKHNRSTIHVPSFKQFYEEVNNEYQKVEGYSKNWSSGKMNMLKLIKYGWKYSTISKCTIPYENLLLVKFTLCCSGTNPAVERLKEGVVN
ncbi:hypothetical protein J437_LFUL014747 [Ladona fulva]|uniref:Uncharacterized protein n=1 Tax=Ladona fulva TaxID=123851 RepID=A0A8K0KK78_LADFU|nr:hypothetical protein J437_LFUL014747 [Ladona fulva]